MIAKTRLRWEILDALHWQSKMRTGWTLETDRHRQMKWLHSTCSCKRDQVATRKPVDFSAQWCHQSNQSRLLPRTRHSVITKTMTKFSIIAIENLSKSFRTRVNGCLAHWWCKAKGICTSINGTSWRCATRWAENLYSCIGDSANQSQYCSVRTLNGIDAWYSRNSCVKWTLTMSRLVYTLK